MICVEVIIDSGSKQMLRTAKYNYQVIDIGDRDAITPHKKNENNMAWCQNDDVMRNGKSAMFNLHFTPYQ